MNIKIIGSTKDFRTDTNILYAQISVLDYLELVGDSFDTDNAIQRKREKHKAYARMKEDIKNGALLPPITLAIRPEYIDNELLEYIDNELLDKLKNAPQIKKAIQPNHIFILDGLQRTFILNDLKNKDHFTDFKQLLLVEIWIEKTVQNLLYRFIVLNGGQKPMSFRHQIDILFDGIAKDLQGKIDGLELFAERDTRRRTLPKQFKTKDIAISYYCFLLADYAPDKESLMLQQIQEENALLSKDRNLDISLFIDFLKIYCELDEIIYNSYAQYKGEKLEEGKDFLAKEHTMNAFFAAVAKFLGNDSQERPDSMQRIRKAIDKLKKTQGDLLGLESFNQVTEAASAAKRNIGLAYKRTLCTGFIEFFQLEGRKSLAEQWLSAYKSSI
jgi:hypothetical protein